MFISQGYASLSLLVQIWRSRSTDSSLDDKKTIKLLSLTFDPMLLIFLIVID